ncbi:MAG: phosphotransferase [Gammaproteobacteria bacterium]|nr:phosphotransferase [Gammaproteobacteria bacterium]
MAAGILPLREDLLMSEHCANPGICAAPGDVTLQWLQAVLNHAGVDATLRDFTADRVGTGQVGQNIRFTLRYARGVGPGTIVGKFASDDPESRQTGVALSNYLREVRFYQELEPTLDIQTPAVLFTDINPDSHEFVLMMQDLAPAVQGDQLAGCEEAEARIALLELAKLHGPRWDDPTLFDYDWLGVQSDESRVMVQGLWDTVFPGFMARYRDRLAADHVTLVVGLNDRLARYLDSRPGPRTVTHGDYRLDNMMFGGPYPLAVVDWQSPGIGLGTADAAYFMGTALDPEKRRDCERNLLGAYHAELERYGISNYSFESCWSDYCRASFAGLVMAVIASMIVGQTPRGDEMFMAMARRSAAMAIDLDAMDRL